MFKNKILEDNSLELVETIKIPPADNLEYVASQNKIYSAGNAESVLLSKELLELK